jgi:hypothetical protein
MVLGKKTQTENRERESNGKGLLLDKHKENHIPCRGLDTELSDSRDFILTEHIECEDYLKSHMGQLDRS